MPAEDLWCRQCADKLVQLMRVLSCPRCGVRAAPYLVDSKGCPACRAVKIPLDGLTCVGPYRGLIGDLVKKYKYARQQHLDHPLGVLLAAALSGTPWWSRLDALVPVPMSWVNRLRYRFHPVCQLGRCVSDKLGIPLLPLIQVHGKRRRQVELPYSQRLLNVRGVFRISRHARVAGARLCVIDDVVTSGTTLHEIARVLKRAGAAAVYGAALARTDPLDAGDVPSPSTGTIGIGGDT